MPPAIPAVIGAGLAAVGGYTVGFLGVTGIAGALLAGTSSLALSALSGAFSGAKQPKAAPTGIQFNVRQAAAPWRVVYGYARVGGVYTFLGTDNDGGPNKKLHMALTFTGHEIADYITWWLDDEELNLVPSDGDEFIPSGRLEHNADMSPRYGTSDQDTPAGLIGVSTDEGGTWTAAHRQRGRAFAYWRFHYNAEKFPNGAPNVSALIKGYNQVYDPRDMSVGWTNNAALCVADYIINNSFGIGADYSDEIDEDVLIAAANVCDELVDTAQASEEFTVGKSTTFLGYTSKQYTYTETREVHDNTQVITTTQTVTNVIELASPGNVALSRGSKIYLSGSSLPGGLSAGTAYYWIPVASTTVTNYNDTGNKLGKLATSEANAQAGTAITISANGSGTVNLTTQAQIQGPDLDGILTGDVVQVSSSGSLPTGLSAATDYYWISRGQRKGEFASSLANARAGTGIALTSVGSGTLTMTRMKEPRYTCNGTFTTDRRPRDILEKMLEAMAGRAVYSGGKWRIYAGVYQEPGPYVLTEDDLAGPIRVQTLKSRRDSFNRVKGTFINPAKRWQDDDFPAVTNETYLMDDQGEKVWKDLELIFTSSPGMSQRLAKIDLERGRQQISAVLSCKLSAMRWRAGDAIKVTLPRMGWDTKIFDVMETTFSVSDAGVIGIEMTIQETAAAVYDWNDGEETQLDLSPNTNLPSPFTIAPPTDLLVTEELYETRGSAGVKARAIVSWTPAQDTLAYEYEVDFRLTSTSTFTGAGKTPTTSMNVDDIAPGTYEFRVRARGLFSTPSTYITKTVTISGLLAPPTEPQDVSFQVLSGFVQLRWSQVPDLDVKIGGSIQWRHSPLTSGAVWSGASPIGEAVPGASTFTILPYLPGTYLAKSKDSSETFSTDAASIVVDVGPAVGAELDSVTEDPSFSGTKTNLTVSGGVLSFSNDSLTGEYEFAGVLDVATTQRVRVSRAVEFSVSAVGDDIDSRDTPIDSWPDFDGASGTDAGSVTVWVASTDDDPGGTPTWSDFQQLDAADFNKRAFRLKAIVTRADASYDVSITALSAKAEELP